jgi:hypothetical protein
MKKDSIYAPLPKSLVTRAIVLAVVLLEKKETIADSVHALEHHLFAKLFDPKNPISQARYEVLHKIITLLLFYIVDRKETQAIVDMNIPDNLKKDLVKTGRILKLNQEEADSIKNLSDEEVFSNSMTYPEIIIKDFIVEEAFSVAMKLEKTNEEEYGMNIKNDHQVGDVVYIQRGLYTNMLVNEEGVQLLGQIMNTAAFPELINEPAIVIETGCNKVYKCGGCEKDHPAPIKIDFKNFNMKFYCDGIFLSTSPKDLITKADPRAGTFLEERRGTQADAIDFDAVFNEILNSNKDEH